MICYAICLWLVLWREEMVDPGFLRWGAQPKGDAILFFPEKKHYENQNILAEMGLIHVPFESASKDGGIPQGIIFLIIYAPK